MDPATGLIDGTPRDVSTSTATVSVTNDWGTSITPATITVTKKS